MEVLLTFTNSAAFCCWVVLFEQCPKMRQGLILRFYGERHVSQMSSRNSQRSYPSPSLSLSLSILFHSPSQPYIIHSLCPGRVVTNKSGKLGEICLCSRGISRQQQWLISQLDLFQMSHLKFWYFFKFTFSHFLASFSDPEETEFTFTSKITNLCKTGNHYWNVSTEASEQKRLKFLFL